jgi:NAD(P)H-hydrate epimerase
VNRHLLLSAEQMREADRRVIAGGVPGIALMRRAGRAVAEVASAMAPPPSRILVLCGPGNNGGDGSVAASLLAEAGHDVVLTCLAPIQALTGDAALAAADWTGPVHALDDAAPQSSDLVIDALFGTGLHRPLEGAAAEAVVALNRSGTPVLAVDVPSGLDADTGAVLGVAVRAARTVTFACRKPGHLIEPGRTLCGLVEIADIGIAPEILTESGAQAFANHPDLWSAALPRPATDGHKYDRGHSVVVSGGPAHTGAARMTARGALRAGSGLVTLVTSARALSVNAAHATAIMLRVCDDADEFADLLTDDRYNAVALGPALGIGVSTHAWVAAALEADRATVLDADALTSFSGDVSALLALTGGVREQPVVLTPHDGEFKRLFAGPGEASADARAVAGAPSKLERARAAAALTGAIVVLKGPDTIVAAPDGRAVVNANGSPHLATAGSGDVLAGIVTGLLAQNMPGYEAACAAVWMHADAAARFGPGLIAEDLPEVLPAVWRGLLG